MTKCSNCGEEINEEKELCLTCEKEKYIETCRTCKRKIDKLAWVCGSRCSLIYGELCEIKK